MHLRTGRLGMQEHVERLKGGKGLRAMCSARLDSPMLAIIEVWPRGVGIRTSIHWVLHGVDSCLMSFKRACAQG
jgi:hypothetical protein